MRVEIWNNLEEKTGLAASERPLLCSDPDMTGCNSRPCSLRTTRLGFLLGRGAWPCVVPEFLGKAHPGPADPTCAALLGSGALQCYSFEHTYLGPFDLSNMRFPSISCPHGCSEVVLSLDTGEGLKGARKREGHAEEERKRGRNRNEKLERGEKE